jgi:uncharacterized RDD family membrane protein YckC
MASDDKPSADQRFAPPSAEVADIAVTDEEQLAGRGTRFLAVIVDVAIQIGAVFLVGRLTPWNVFSPEMMTDSFGNQLTGLMIGLGTFVLINGWLLVDRGQTVGKMITGIRIVRHDGSKVDPVRIIGLRYGIGYVAMLVPVVGFLYGLIDALFIFRANRRCVHDLIADTIVVKA